MSVRKLWAAVSVLTMGFAAGAANADTIADWNFDTLSGLSGGTTWSSANAVYTLNPITADSGNGTATMFHSNSDFDSSKAVGSSNHLSAYYANAGYGSTGKALSSDNWLAGDYYQFQVNTQGASGISLSWNQYGSGTSPKDFELQYSTDGTNFTNFGAIAIAATSTWQSSTEDLSSIVGLNDQQSVFFRLLDLDSTSISGGTVGVAGTDRIDNFTVAAASQVSAVPLPAAVWLFGSGVLGLAGMRRRNGAAA